MAGTMAVSMVVVASDIIPKRLATINIMKELNEGVIFVDKKERTRVDFQENNPGGFMVFMSIKPKRMNDGNVQFATASHPSANWNSTWNTNITRHIDEI